MCPSFETIDGQGCGPPTKTRIPDTAVDKVEPNLMSNVAVAGSTLEPTLVVSKYKSEGLNLHMLGKDLTVGLGSMNYAPRSLSFLHDVNGIMTVSYTLGERGQIHQTVSYDTFVKDVRDVYVGKLKGKGGIVCNLVTICLVLFSYS